MTLAPAVELSLGAVAEFSRYGAVLRVGSMEPALLGQLERLAAGRLPRVGWPSGSASLTLGLLLDRLERRGWLNYVVTEGERTLACARPRGRTWSTQTVADGAGDLCLAPACHLVAEGDHLLVVSPVSGFEVELLSPSAMRAVAPRLVDGCRTDEQLVTECRRLLVAVGVLVTGCEGAVPGPDPVGYWEPHDVAFHTASREGFTRHRFGGSYRFPGTQPTAVDDASPVGECVELASPDIPVEQLPRGHVLRTLASRQSVRRHGTEPMTLVTLGHFLHHVARCKGTLETDHGRVERRPYPSGGAIHELSLHLVVHRVEDLPRGVYRYRPRSHLLEAEVADTGHVAALLGASALATMRADPPDVLVVVTAQVPRLAWKYEGIAYSLVLKHVGVLMQTMYLVAAALGLSACGVGGGDAVRFAEATGLDPFEEASVGEFILGSLPADLVAEQVR